MRSIVDFTMLTKRPYIACLTVMLLTVFSLSLTGWPRCEGCLAHDADEAQCIECIYDSPILIHEPMAGLEISSAALIDRVSGCEQFFHSDGYPAGVFRPPNTFN